MISHLYKWPATLTSRYSCDWLFDPADPSNPTWKSAGPSSAKPLTKQEVEAVRAREAEELSCVDAEISQLTDLVPLLENWDEYCCASAL
eukprot:1176006-Prorocentrum_minimum.AAC.2